MLKIKYSLFYIGCEKESKSYMWIYVLMGNMLRGIGETPIEPLGISYLDDFAKGGQSSVYIGKAQKCSIEWELFLAYPWNNNATVTTLTIVLPGRNNFERCIKLLLKTWWVKKHECLKPDAFSL